MNKFENEARNHHYISQGEQRRNAIPGTKAKKIFSFEVDEREPLRLGEPKKVAIKSNLSFVDLFTFARGKGERTRKNLEDIFKRYEDQVGEVVPRILGAVSSGEPPSDQDIHRLFVSKFLNFMRSPYSVRKALDTFGEAEKYRMTDPELSAIFDEVTSASRVEKREARAVFDISPEEYEAWLRAMFNTLTVVPQTGVSILEEAVGSLMTQTKVLVRVHTYTEGNSGNVCFLSDRGFVELGSDPLIFLFNMTSTSFVTFAFRGKNALPGLSDASWDLIRGRIDFASTTDDLGQLRLYNVNAAYQCASRVFASHASPPR